jgi:hypothetical protein
MNAWACERAPDAVEGCLESCRRCEAVIASVLDQDPSVYAAVGPHLRHCLDHFQLLLDGWPSGAIDYDDRARDARTERDPVVARESIRDIVRRLLAIRDHDLGREISVLQAAAPGRRTLPARSRLERELVFLSSHTIHHIAIMILSAREAGVTIPAELGVAYSTEAHRSSLAAHD